MILEWLRSKRCKWDSRVTEALAGGGYVELLQWAMREGCRVTPRAVEMAAMRGDLLIVKMLLETRKLQDIYHPSSTDLYGNDVQPQYDACEHAAMFVENIDVLVYLVDHEKMVFDEWAGFAAALAGNMKALVFLSQRGLQKSPVTCRAAARCGNIALLEWLDEEGWVINEDCLVEAAGRGELAVLRWLKDKSIKHPMAFPRTRNGIQELQGNISNAHGKVHEWLKEIMEELT